MKDPYRPCIYSLKIQTLSKQYFQFSNLFTSINGKLTLLGLNLTWTYTEGYLWPCCDAFLWLADCLAASLSICFSFLLPGPGFLSKPLGFGSLTVLSVTWSPSRWNADSLSWSENGGLPGAGLVEACSSMCSSGLYSSCTIYSGKYILLGLEKTLKYICLFIILKLRRKQNETSYWGI